MTAGLVEALKKLLKTRGITYRDLARALDLSEPSIKRLFSERTLTVPKTLRLRRDGPIRRVHGKSVVAGFIQADFDASGGLFRFEIRELSKASTALLHRRLERLALEFNELAELDSYLPSDQRETI